MTGKSILMLIGEFSEEYEIFVVQQALEAVGHTVDIIYPDAGAGARIRTSV
ncbi:MAG: protease, partial [Pseudomonadota bacterium]